jgi:hypothetical protein
VELARPLQDLVEDEARPLVAFLSVDLVEGVQPLLRLGRVYVGQLVLELVEVGAVPRFRSAIPGRAYARGAGSYFQSNAAA